MGFGKRRNWIIGEAGDGEPREESEKLETPTPTHSSRKVTTLNSGKALVQYQARFEYRKVLEIRLSPLVRQSHIYGISFIERSREIGLPAPTLLLVNYGSTQDFSKSNERASWRDIAPALVIPSPACGTISVAYVLLSAEFNIEMTWMPSRHPLNISKTYTHVNSISSPSELNNQLSILNQCDRPRRGTGTLFCDRDAISNASAEEHKMCH